MSEKKSELSKTYKRNLANTYQEKEENLANTYREEEEKLANTYREKENLAIIYQKPMKNVLPLSLILYKTILARHYKKEATNEEKKNDLPNKLILYEITLARHYLPSYQDLQTYKEEYKEKGKKNEINTRESRKNNQITIKDLHIYKLLSIYSKLFTHIVNYQFKIQFQFNFNQFN